VAKKKAADEGGVKAGIINPEKIAILHYLEETGAKTPKQLASKFQIESSRLAEHLVDLIGLGVIRPDPEKPTRFEAYKGDQG
jgi:DNA-binding MarR family transcriptional regulator